MPEAVLLKKSERARDDPQREYEAWLDKSGEATRKRSGRRGPDNLLRVVSPDKSSLLHVRMGHLADLEMPLQTHNQLHGTAARGVRLRKSEFGAWGE